MLHPFFAKRDEPTQSMLYQSAQIVLEGNG